jgi:hypothetical protein
MNIITSLKTYLTNGLLLILLLFLSNCQEEEKAATSQENNQATVLMYKGKIEDYWGKLIKDSSDELISKIEELSTATDLNSLKIYDLRTTEKLVIADVKSLNGLDGIIKIIFYLNEDKLVRSSIVTLKTNETNIDYNKVIQSVVNADKKDFNYTGEIAFLSLTKTKLLYDKFNQGNLIENANLSAGTKSKKTSKTQANCTDYFWVTKYGDVIISEIYMFSVCDCSGGGGPNEDQTSKMSNCDSDSGTFLGGGSTGASSSVPTLPINPVNNQSYRFTDPDGVCTVYKYNSSLNRWVIIEVILPNIIIAANRDNYGILYFQWPVNYQKVFDSSTNLLYTYDGGSDSWSGVPKTAPEAIEEQIDDSQLDPCSKSVLAKLKVGTQSDIAKMISRFSPSGSIFNIHMSIGTVTNSNDAAQTTRETTSTYDINMVFNEDYINGVGNTARPTDLSIATTMAHEIIHAYLISIVSEFHNCGATTICDFPALYDAYVDYQISKDPTIIPSTHHELIAKNYVNVIAATIQEFHTGIPVELGKASQIYTDLAWSGLSKTSIFNTKYPDDPNNVNYKERQRILDRFTNEKNYENRGGLNPVGTPCPKQ